MPVHNAEIARILNQLADLLEIEAANQFRVRAYREAADTIGSLSRSVADMVAQGEDLSKIRGIGADMAGKIVEIVQTGKLAQLEQARQRTPLALADMLSISGLGPKRVKTLHAELGITNLEELQEAARQGRIRQLRGFGKKLEQEILASLERNGGREKRTLLRDAEQIAEPLLAYLKKSKVIEEVAIAGSYRRRKETVGDLDLVAASQSGEKVIEHFVRYEGVIEVLSQGKTSSAVRLQPGIRVDLRVVPRQSYGAVLFHFTGSRAHNLKLRNMALDRDLKINEYGVFKGDEQLAGRTEEDLYAVFDLPYIEPELREDRSEVEAAQAGELPSLIRLEDLRGDLQAHTNASDGRATMEELAQAAVQRGYDYLAISDHAQAPGIVSGLDANQLARQLDEIDRLNESLPGLRLLKSVEVDILEDGSLALPNDVLERLDLTICSVHQTYNLSRQEQTERIIRAMDNPNFNILSHPTGRRISQRDPMDLDLERLMQAALQRGCFLELNAHADRLDLDDRYCKMAKEMGLQLAISTDAHRVEHLEYARFGVYQARRGWLEAQDVLNTRSWEDLKRLLNRK